MSSIRPINFFRLIFEINFKFVLISKHSEYLGVLMNDNWKTRNEVRSRIKQGWTTFIKWRKMLGRILACILCITRSALCECWIMESEKKKRIEAFDTYTYRRVLRISWMDKIANAVVLNRMRKQKEMFITVKQKNMPYFGHIMRGPKY